MKIERSLNLRVDCICIVTYSTHLNYCPICLTVQLELVYQLRDHLGHSRSSSQTVNAKTITNTMTYRNGRALSKKRVNTYSMNPTMLEICANEDVRHYSLSGAG